MPHRQPSAGDGQPVAAANAAVARRLAAAGIDSSALDARLLLCAATGASAAGLIARPERRLNAAEQVTLDGLAARRAAREPMAHILGRREFWSLDFAVSPHVLTPRPDSETLIDAVCRRLRDRLRPYRVLDLGTGSGCLLLALLSEYPAASGLGVDISADAAAVAAGNARRLGFAGRAMFVVADWTAALDTRFDVVLCNPPYIRGGEIAGLAPEVAQFEPRGALDGGADGLDAYRALLSQVGEILAPDGLAAFELGEGQAAAVSTLAVNHGFCVPELVADLAGIDRVAILRQPSSRF